MNMLERATVKVLRGLREMESAEELARAALLAALDPEDEALVNLVGKAMYDHTRTDPRFRNRVAWEDNPDAQEYQGWFARAAITAVRDLSQPPEQGHG